MAGIFDEQFAIDLEVGSEENFGNEVPRTRFVGKQDGLLRHTIRHQEHHHDKQKIRHVDCLNKNKTIALVKL